MTNLSQTPNLSYQVSFHKYHDHLACVRLTFTAPTDSPTLWLPTWIAGSYLVREFAKHIAHVRYTTAYFSGDDGFYMDNLDTAIKTSKNTYTLPTIKQGECVNVFYDVYCHDLSVRTAFVDNTRIFGNFTSLLMMVAGLERHICQIRLSVPRDFMQKNYATLTIGLSYHVKIIANIFNFILPDLVAFDSYDYPFEISSQTQFDFHVMVHKRRPICHQFFIAGRHNTDMSRLQTDVQKICQSYVDWLGDVPFDDYTFMTMATGSEYGGLEHINSSTLITPRTDLPSVLEGDEPSEDYQRFLGLCSHEYFHAWWVKSVKPDVMMNNDLTTESYTPLLWVFEGFTSYLDDLMLLRAGVINKDSYLRLLTNQLNRYAQTDGRIYQSVAESSLDTWIKLYRPDENTQNQSVSYYNKGALVALCLDLMLIKSGHRLFDVIKHFYKLCKQSLNKRYGLTTDELGRVVSDMMGVDEWQMFYDNYVIGTTELPITDMLRSVGITVNTKNMTRHLGMSVKEDPMGLKINHLQRDSRASRSGLSVGDIIIAIDGIKASKDHLKHTLLLSHTTQHDLCIHAFRRDELMVFDIISGQDMNMSHDDYTLSGDGGAWLNF